MKYHAFLLADRKWSNMDHVMSTCNEEDFAEYIALRQYHDKATRPEE